MKQCSKCQQDKDVNSFSKDKQRKDGYRPYCRECDRIFRDTPERKAYMYEHNRRWRKENPDKVKVQNRKQYSRHMNDPVLKARYYERNKLWIANNPEKAQQSMLKAGRKWRLHNLEKQAALSKSWRLRNKTTLRMYDAKRRSLKLKAPGTYTAKQLQAKIDYYGGLCYICSAPYEAIDHVIPLSKGGTNWLANLKPVCHRCNRSKNNKSLLDFKATRPRERSVRPVPES